jgi:hypothetical protein
MHVAPIVSGPPVWQQSLTRRHCPLTAAHPDGYPASASDVGADDDEHAVAEASARATMKNVRVVLQSETLSTPAKGS